MPSRRTLLKSVALLAGAPLVAHAGEIPLHGKVIPSSGERIPVIGIGTNRYGVGDNAEAIKPLQATLARFAELGGGLIDTAPSYGNSESVLGQLLEPLAGRDRFFIATKCDVAGGDATRTQVAASAANLESTSLDLVAVHNIRNWQQQLPVLQQLQADKKIRYVGITTSRTSQFAEFSKIMESQELDFVQLNYSLADRTAEQRLLSIAADKGIAVVVNLAFARGRLFDAVKGRSLPAWAAEFDTNSWAQLFLKYVVSHPAVTCVIPGTTKVRHLEDNLGAAQGRMPNPEQRARIEKLYSTL